MNYTHSKIHIETALLATKASKTKLSGHSYISVLLSIEWLVAAEVGALNYLHVFQVEDTAVYTCRASNEAGESDISYQVDVQGKYST